MKILAIETSCDETSIAVIDFPQGSQAPGKILFHLVHSQADLHAPYGGVFPELAKREHVRILPQQVALAAQELGWAGGEIHPISQKSEDAVKEWFSRSSEVADFICGDLAQIIPDIDAIAVTAGPGLAPALWVGVNMARSLALIWGKPLLPINHMEGHILSVMSTGDSVSFTQPQLPVLSLLISGGHTELVIMDSWLSYTKIGQTRDDAVGEAFDKVARVVGLPYPGGPHVSRLAKLHSENPEKVEPPTLPRPMIASKDLDFSFSGIKTAVRRLVDADPTYKTDEIKKQALCFEFQESCSEVLVKKTKKAILETDAKTLIVAGGVSANSRITSQLSRVAQDLGVTCIIPERSLTGDNAAMIAVAAATRIHSNPELLKPQNMQTLQELRANGNWSLSDL
jgi:N6-L-threonylcarbamoyladenine synthase